MIRNLVGSVRYCSFIKRQQQITNTKRNVTTIILNDFKKEEIDMGYYFTFLGLVGNERVEYMTRTNTSVAVPVDI